MVPGQAGTILRQLNHLLETESAREQTDAQLLQRFAARREEAAFAALLARHARLVWDVCRHTLGHDQDAEDAFQATFLILARRAGTIRKGASVGSWLYGVAYRTAVRTRQNAVARRAREQRAAVAERQPTGCDAGLRELQAILAEEVHRLADKYRAVFVLCCLQGKTKREAADELGWKEGTVASRLAQARKLLQNRLTRRGVVLAAALTLAAVTAGSGKAAVPATLLAATLKAAPAFAAGQTAGIVSTSVTVLTEGVLQTMFLSNLKFALLLGLAAVLVAGTVALGQQGFEKKPTPATADQPELAKPARRVAPPKEPVKDDAEKLQGAWVLATTVDDNNNLTADRTEPRTVFRDDKISLQLGRINTDGVLLEEIRIWETVKGTFELSSDQKPKRMTLKGAWISKFNEREKEATFHAIYRLEGPILTVLLPQPGKEPPNDFEVERGSGQRLLVFHRATPGAGKGTTEPAPELKTRIFKGHLGTVWTIAVSPDGRTIASGGDDGTIVLWDAQTGQMRSKPWNLLDGEGKPARIGVAALLFYADGKQLVVGADDRVVRLFDVETGVWLREFAGPNRASAGAAPLVLTADGKSLLAGPRLADQIDEEKKRDKSADGSIRNSYRRWDMGTAKLVNERKIGDDGWVCALSQTGTQLATVAVKDNAVVIWEMDTGKEIERITGIGASAVTTLEFSPDGKVLALGRANGSVRLVNLADAKTSDLGARKQQIKVKAAKAELDLAKATKEEAFQRWDAMEAACKKVPNAYSLEDRRGAKLIYDFRVISEMVKQEMLEGAELEVDGGNTQLDVKKQKVKTARAELDTASASKEEAFHRLESIEAACKRVPQAYSLEDWQGAKLTYERYVKEEDAKQAALEMAELDLGAPRKKEPPESTVVSPTKARINALAFSPDGELVAAITADGIVTVLDATTGKLQAEFKGHDGPVVSVAFTPDGKTVLSGGVDRTVRLWKVK